jgi:tetratricopeptide (TPR) repeat protein
LELKGDCQGAIENYEKAMSIDSEQFNTKSDIAWILAACPDSKYRDSEKAHKQATEFSESQRKYKTLRTLAAAYAGKGDYANALIYQEKAVQALQEKEYNNELEKIYYEDQLKQSMEQLNSYRKEIPWYF